MAWGDSAAGNGDEHEGPDGGSLGVHVGEVGEDFGDLLAAGQGAEADADSHDDQADAEHGVDLADDLVDGDEGRGEVVGDDDGEPEDLVGQDAAQAAVGGQGDDQTGGADCEHGADHDQQDDGEDAHDVLHRGSEVDAGDLGDGGAVVALGQHAGEVVMHSTGKHGAEGDPQEDHRSPHGTGQGAEDGAEAGNVQKLDHEQLPLGQDDVVDTVVDGDGRGLTVVGVEGAVYVLAVEQVAADQNGQAQEKANHFFFLLLIMVVLGINRMFISL